MGNSCVSSQQTNTKNIQESTDHLNSIDNINYVEQEGSRREGDAHGSPQGKVPSRAKRKGKKYAQGPSQHQVQAQGKINQQQHGQPVNHAGDQRNFTENKKLRPNHKNSQPTIASLEKITQGQDQQITDLQGRSRHLEDELNREKDRSVKEIQNLRSERGTREQKIASLEKIIQGQDQQITELQGRSRHLEDGLNLEREKHRQANDEVRALKEQNRELTLRLSQAYGSKLTDQNPDIADLSDQNRPTKIAEKYSELYDNEWTDAFDVLEKRYKSDKDNRLDKEQAGRKACQDLLEILICVYKSCSDEAYNDLEELTAAVTKFKGGSSKSEIIKTLKDERKKNYTSRYETVVPVVKGKLDSRFQGLIRDSNVVEKYTSACMEICWLMSIQDPPCCIDTDSDKVNQPLNTHFHKEYTKSGTSIEYVVWPVLYLKADGAVLAKGVAQGDGNKPTRRNQGKAETVYQQTSRTSNPKPFSKTMHIPSQNTRTENANSVISDASGCSSSVFCQGGTVKRPAPANPSDRSKEESTDPIGKHSVSKSDTKYTTPQKTTDSTPSLQPGTSKDSSKPQSSKPTSDRKSGIYDNIPGRQPDGNVNHQSHYRGRQRNPDSNSGVGPPTDYKTLTHM